MYKNLVTPVRLLMGVAYFVSGFNWWVKLITPYPSIADFTAQPPPPDIVGAMIQTGFMFHVVKATELLAGLALLCNRFVPLMLVVVYPVTVSIFLFDMFVVATVRGFVMGGGAFAINSFLMLAYFSSYAPMLRFKVEPDSGSDAENEGGSFGIFMRVFSLLALLLAIAIVTWLVVLIVQHAMYPQSLMVPRGPQPGP